VAAIGSSAVKSRTTIGVVAPSFEDVGGVPSVADFILRTIARRHDFDVRVVSLATSAEDPCSLLVSDPRSWMSGVRSRRGHCRGADFTHVGARFGEFEFQRLAPRASLARELAGCDLIQVVAGVPAWACPVLGLGKPVLLQVATLTKVERQARARATSGPKAVWRSVMTEAAARLDQIALRSVDVVMVENPWMQRYAEGASPTERTQVIYAPPGIDAEVFRPAGRKPTGEGRYILAVGRFSDERKNPGLLLEAYSRLCQQAPAAPGLVLAGPDDPGKAFWDRAGALGVRSRITAHVWPMQDELVELFRNADCLALSSDEEGFGVVVIEAMACEAPVVSTRCGGPDGIITDEVDGFLVARDDPQAMADRLAWISGHPTDAREMGRRARATVERRYADHVAGDVFLAAYDRLLGRDPTRPAPVEAAAQ
jgi:glycosyltransferase involved in cell wall biosynthesis